MKGRQFWSHGDDTTAKGNGDCCSFHILGPPESPVPGIGVSPLWDYESEIVDAIKTYKRIGIHKCRGAGASSLSLYWALHKVFAEGCRGSAVFVTGIGYLLSTAMARSCKMILAKHDIYTNDNMTTITFPQARFIFAGSDSKSLRGMGLTNLEVFLIVCDEVAEFETDIFASIDPLLFKSGGKTECILITTPGNDLNSKAHEVFTNKNNGLYHIIDLPVSRIIGKQLTVEQNELLKSSSSSYKNEFLLMWGQAATGSVYDSVHIEHALKQSYDHNFINPSSMRYIGIDPKTNFAITVTQWNNDAIEVLYSEEFQKPDYLSNLETVSEIVKRYSPCKLYVDGSSDDLVRSIKADPLIKDRIDYHNVIHEYRSMGLESHQVEQFLGRVIPINMSTRNRDVLIHSIKCMSSGQMRIDGKAFPKLVAALSSATSQDGKLIKLGPGVGQFLDTLESWMYSLQGYRWGGI
jgi:hypothetical protein